jgi:RNA polymerase sigma-70 factor (ECF subfamily)
LSQHPASASLDEQVLLEQLAAGNEQALRHIMDRYWFKLYRYAVTVVHSPQAAQEIVQDVFIRIWHKRETLAGVNSLDNYLFITGRNQVISAMRRQLQATTPDTPETLVETALPPDRRAEYRDLDRLLHRAIDRLPPQQKRVITMSRLEGMSHDLIAEEIGISRETVKKHVMAGLTSIRTYLYVQGGELLLLAMAFLFNLL